MGKKGSLDLTNSRSKSYARRTSAPPFDSLEFGDAYRDSMERRIQKSSFRFAVLASKVKRGCFEADDNPVYHFLHQKTYRGGEATVER
jgi:hypothetical protein